MKTNPIISHDQTGRGLSVAAFVLFIIGIFLPFLRVTFRDTNLSSVMIFSAVGAEILALAFGAISSRWRLGKIAFIGAGIVCLLGIVNLIRFYLS
jgi:hypothetical protein